MSDTAYADLTDRAQKCEIPGAAPGAMIGR